MANIKSVRIVGDVPFDWLDTTCDLNAESVQLVARALLGPVMGLTHRYERLPGLVENGRGGLTAMYRLTIEGREALTWGFLQHLAHAVKDCSPLAKLHIAEARDEEFRDEPYWEHIVDAAELSGEAVS